MSRLQHSLLILVLSLFASVATGAARQEKAGSDSAAQKERDLKRQARALVAATQDLQRAARTALGAEAGRATLIDNSAQLALAAERFDKSLQNQGDLKQRQKDFADVDKVWARIVLGLELLKPAENVTLLKSAFAADRIHENLYRLLEIKSKRTGLSVQS
jgi:hypothetical protein